MYALAHNRLIVTSLHDNSPAQAKKHFRPQHLTVLYMTAEKKAMLIRTIAYLNTAQRLTPLKILAMRYPQLSVQAHPTHLG